MPTTLLQAASVLIVRTSRGLMDYGAEIRQRADLQAPDPT
jgi:hypothetical protein